MWLQIAMVTHLGQGTLSPVLNQSYLEMEQDYVKMLGHKKEIINNDEYPQVPVLKKDINIQVK